MNFPGILHTTDVFKGGIKAIKTYFRQAKYRLCFVNREDNMRTEHVWYFQGSWDQGCCGTFFSKAGVTFKLN